MLKLKLSDALNAAEDAVTKSDNRDNENPLVKKVDDNPYRITNRDYRHHSSFAYTVADKIDDMCIYECFVNTALFLINDVDEQDYINTDYIDELVKDLAAIANDDYREDSINPSIVKLYTANLIHSWKVMAKTKAIKASDIVNANQLGVTTLKLAQQIKQLDTDKALLVQSFIESLTSK